MSKTLPKQKKRRGPGRALLRLHRRVGVALSAIFILICVTGILLNHSDDLDFQSRTVEADWIYDWYGLQPAGEVIHYSLGQHSLASLDGQLFLDKRSLGHFPPPIGAAPLENLIAVAFPKSMLLLTREGEIIETIPPASLPGDTISQIVTDDQRTLIIDTDAGPYRSDESIIDWSPIAEPNRKLETIAASPAPDELTQHLLRAFRGEGITWGRVLLDIHTGRFFGSAGKWIADLSGIALILLTLTGVFYTMRYLKKARERSLSR
ncbi:PepSY domain-containing protein [Pelagicoccus sp. NFK12]|uniref:PepSY domain-containing protein n=1 Tax=Pelagicoccus enzymogenes TaxID=2773457 RepID=A0A927III6_9BACT|nr:PepSY-associated TM helix domain-containing protein [Pelagicoccus enzymogenes]MBD5781306.1 PepSY domain-containing protein [Pelagicoccus enzymogenes]MDQ8198792.1 PepSY-associated TM helix domain-containing protein [Pelagicoccus enzymogenes]